MSVSLIVLISAGAVSLLGLLWAITAYQRARGSRRVLRGVALLLLPIGLYFSGGLDLLTNGIQSLVDWAYRTVLTPRLIAGFVVLGLSALLWFGSGLLRPVTRQESRARREARALKHISAQARPGTGGQPAPKKGASSSEDDEVEALLKKRGIE